MPRIVPDDRVRQGPSGRPILAVLVGALILCGAALTGYLVWVWSSSPEGSPTATTTAAPPAPSAVNPSAQVPPANPAYPAPAEPPTTGATRQP